MTQFPSVDPIPLPAPVWLFKILHDLTFALHLTSVDLLLAGIMVALVFSLMGRGQPAGMIMHRLPTLMAFVINLGVPPLLFAQVLYGRALYTSSVLIGAWWISVIFLLMASYYGLYAAAKRADSLRPWRAPGFAALLLVLTIAFIYSNNMTLMIRPQAWVSMYHASPSGLQLNTGDPTLWPRWLFFITGALPVGGAALALLALRSDVDAATMRFLRTAGAVSIALGLAVEAGFGAMALGAQASGVVTQVMRDPLYGSFVRVWIATAVLLFACGLVLKLGRAAAIAAALAGFLNVASTVMVRDGIRDYTLRAAGFEVWDRAVVTNWSVVGLFLVLFVAALGVAGYLISVVAKARRIEERYA
jgi:hypothetical protein